MPSEYTVRWQGGRIGLGASVFHFAGTNSPTVAQGAANAIKAFFVSISSTIGTGISWQFDPEVRVMSADGTLTAVIPVTAPAAQSATGGTDWTNGSGYMIRWNTASIVGGRRLLGRTFMVPAESGVFLSGNVTGLAIGQVGTACSTLISAMAANSSPLQIWSRKNAITSDVTGFSVPGRPTTLRTRNDRD